MGDKKKLNDGNESVMSANLEEDTEVNKAWHPYLKSDLAHYCNVLFIVFCSLFIVILCYKSNG